jgi:hypothetical protein
MIPPDKKSRLFGNVLIQVDGALLVHLFRIAKT